MFISKVNFGIALLLDFSDNNWHFTEKRRFSFCIFSRKQSRVLESFPTDSDQLKQLKQSHSCYMWWRVFHTFILLKRRKILKYSYFLLMIFHPFSDTILASVPITSLTIREKIVLCLSQYLHNFNGMGSRREFPMLFSVA